MTEIELKAVLDDFESRRRRMVEAGGTLVYAGRLLDRRYDTPDRALASRDIVLRLRSYPDADPPAAEIGWKGPTSYAGGFKMREELGAPTGDALALGEILLRSGFVITIELDREIAQFELGGAVVRFERYPRMDDLVEVEGEPPAIERAIAALGMPRESFSSERLSAFVERYESRTGEAAALSAAELSGGRSFDHSDA